jgi:4-alpha-glucanotransferase
MRRRGSGVLLHLSSLPSPFGIGDLGPQARQFADFLADTGQSYWQILPLNPTDPLFDNSPYHSISAFAFNPLLISPELLAEDGLLEKGEVEAAIEPPRAAADFALAIARKRKLLTAAFERFRSRGPHPEYDRFCAGNAWWLEDYALFVPLREHFGGQAWNEWPSEVCDRVPAALRALKNELREPVEREKFIQYAFHSQWTALRSYCRARGISLIGDIPIYGDYDSSDLWAHPELFKLDHGKRPYVVSGVPPDYFSSTGQLWGNPVYRWDMLRERGYDWWVERIRHNLGLFDFVRIDHFRGLVACWEVPAGETSAVNGRWVEAPAVDFLNHLVKAIPCLPIIAEDLGLITPDVREVMRRFDLPGMKVLLFAFGPDMPSNPYIPHNAEGNCLYYTGTHDNNTVRGWFESEASPEERRRVFEYLGREIPAQNLPWEMIRLVMMSSADTAIFPLQDILGLGREARMNVPAVPSGNWGWRFLPGQLTPDCAVRLRRLTETCGRT